MREYNKAVLIGKFQLFHNEHNKLIDYGLSLADELLVVVGSYRAPRDPNYPFTFDERVEMISAARSREDLFRIKFIPIPDYHYKNNVWLAEVQAKTSVHISPSDNVALIGSYKDRSSSYCEHFKAQWAEELTSVKIHLNATDLRRKMFDVGDNPIEHEHNGYHPNKPHKDTDLTFLNDLPEGTAEWLKKNYLGNKDYHNCLLEYQYAARYKQRWNGWVDPGVDDILEKLRHTKKHTQEDIELLQSKIKDGWKAPFPPFFVTVDAIVVKSGHVLLVKRKFHPGKGKYALPGGFIKENELIEDAVLRELKEETGIQVPKDGLRNNVKETKVFGHPGRSLRGRTITNAYFIDLGAGPLPPINSGSDAETCFWMSFADIHNNQEHLFEDHYSIVSWFINRS